MKELIELTKQEFERVIELTYKRGIVRDPNKHVSETEVGEVISDIYHLLRRE